MFPWEFIELSVPNALHNEDTVAVEPWHDTHCNTWISPNITTVVAGAVCVPNTSPYIVSIKKQQHIAQVRVTCIPSEIGSNKGTSNNHRATKVTTQLYSEDICIDPKSDLSVSAGKALHHSFDTVFNPQIG